MNLREQMRVVAMTGAHVGKRHRVLALAGAADACYAVVEPLLREALVALHNSATARNKFEEHRLLIAKIKEALGDD